MARQQRFDWFLSLQQNRRSSRQRKRQSSQPRRAQFEPLEARNLLSINGGCSLDSMDLPAPPVEELHPHVLWASREEFERNGSIEPEEFDARTPWDDQDPLTDGIQITYSYSNFLDGSLLGGLTVDELTAATEEALGLWASVTPLQFIEVVDSGPPVSDGGYPAANHPTLRIGHHFIDGPSSVLAHAYFPTSDGIGGDVHFDNGDTWSINPANGGIDVIEVMTHELGHALGLGHEFTLDAIMNPFYGGRYNGPGTGFLLEDDINGIQELYGEGEGGVIPLRLVVDTIDDEIDDDTSEGDLSLREALIRAKEIDRAQVIKFSPQLAGQTIVLDPALSSIVIDTKVTIEGLGADLLTIEAPDTSETAGDGMQIFVVDDGDDDVTTRVTISGMTLRGADSANAGGAINSVEELTLQGVSLQDNYSAVAGGAIFTNNRVNIENSTLTNNHSGGAGGAIATEGLNTGVVIVASTISGNSATGNGGGISILDENPAKFRILHSTVVDNHADSDDNGTGTGGGAYMFDGVLALEHSIIAGNSDNGTAPDLDNVNIFTNAVVLAKYSLVGDVEGSQITQRGPNLFNVDPMLQPLADNGGATMTHLPQDGSPIVNAGNPLIPFPADFDQRGLGFRRIREGVIDIGAVESGGFSSSFTVNTLIDKSDVNFNGIDTSPQDLSLREAIELANLNLGPNLINFAESLNGGTIALSGSLGGLVITDSTTIDAGGLPGGITIDGHALDPAPEVNNGGGVQLLQITDGIAEEYSDVELIGLTLTGGDVNGNGGAINSSENLTLRFVSVLDNYATGNGGGIYHKAGATGGTLLIENSTLANNEAGSNGGGLWSNTNLPAEVEPGEDPDPNPIVGKIIHTTISGNLAGEQGGGIINFDGQLELRHVTITENEAANGSGIVSFSDTFTKTLVYSSIIAGNVIHENNPATIVDNTGFDVQRSNGLAFNSFESLGYNLIGSGNSQLVFNNNDQVGVTDLKLLPLGNYGGKTMTHALDPDSPAVDAGDPNAILPGETSTEDSVVVSENDQRGDGFSRIGDGDTDGTARIDIGAFEIQTPTPSGDFDNDGDVDGADFLAWQRGHTNTEATRSDGDANFDGVVNGDDFDIWTQQLGTQRPASVVSTLVSTQSAVVASHSTVEQQSDFAADSHTSARPDSNPLLTAAAYDTLARQAVGKVLSTSHNEFSKESPADRALVHWTTPLAHSQWNAFTEDGKLSPASNKHQQTVDMLDVVFESLDLADLFRRGNI